MGSHKSADSRPMLPPIFVPRFLRPHLPRTEVRKAEVDLGFYPLMSTGLVAGMSALVVSAASQLPDVLPWRSYDPHAGENLFELGANRGEIVVATDGTPLSVLEVGPQEAPLTVVFAHGYTLARETFHFQATALRAKYGDDLRMVFYDQRGHAQSGRARKSSYNLEQLARDLRSVLDTVVPEGPVVLVGHSMGGMTTLTFAEMFPEYVRERVVGVGLLATAATKLPDAGLPAMLENPLITGLTWAVDHAPRVVSGGRKMLGGVIEPFLKAGSFGDPTTVGDTIIDFTNRLISSTDVEVMAAFVESLTSLDATAGLDELQDVTVTIVCGDADLLTPVNRSVEIARALPSARFVVVPGAGHMIQLEAITVVNEELMWLIDLAFEQCGIERDPAASAW